MKKKVTFNKNSSDQLYVHTEKREVKTDFKSKQRKQTNKQKRSKKNRSSGALFRKGADNVEGRDNRGPQAQYATTQKATK